MLRLRSPGLPPGQSPPWDRIGPVPFDRGRYRPAVGSEPDTISGGEGVLGQPLLRRVPCYNFARYCGLPDQVTTPRLLFSRGAGLAVKQRANLASHIAGSNPRRMRARAARKIETYCRHKCRPRRIESERLITEMSQLSLRANARCNMRIAIPLAHRRLRNENAVALPSAPPRGCVRTGLREGI
jgi:hypothetical protein